jgi:hypothetical protein
VLISTKIWSWIWNKYRRIFYKLIWLGHLTFLLGLHTLMHCILPDPHQVVPLYPPALIRYIVNTTQNINNAKLKYSSYQSFISIYSCMSILNTNFFLFKCSYWMIRIFTCDCSSLSINNKFYIFYLRHRHAWALVDRCHIHHWSYHLTFFLKVRSKRSIILRTQWVLKS